MLVSNSTERNLLHSDIPSDYISKCQIFLVPMLLARWHVFKVLAGATESVVTLMRAHCPKHIL